MTRAARPLDRFPLIRTQNTDEMRAALARVYAKPTFYLERHTKKADVTLNLYHMKDIGLGYTKYGIDMSLVYPESDVTLQTFPIRGQGEATFNATASPLSPRHGITVSPGTGFAVKLNANYEHFILLINTQVLTRKLAAITGASINRPLRFHPTRDEESATAKAFRDHVSFLVEKVSASSVPFPKLVLAEFEQTLMVMLLHANQHNYSHLLERAPPDVAPWQVRRAEEYVEANWQQAITLEDLAQVTGVSAFSLFRSFRNSRGYSPMEFVNRLRLSHARKLLQRAEATTTVAEVAYTCGFVDFRRFANDYIQAYGEQASQTLNRGKNTGPG